MTSATSASSAESATSAAATPTLQQFVAAVEDAVKDRRLSYETFVVQVRRVSIAHNMDVKLTHHGRSQNQRTEDDVHITIETIRRMAKQIYDDHMSRAAS